MIPCYRICQLTDFRRYFFMKQRICVLKYHKFHKKCLLAYRRCLFRRVNSAVKFLPLSIQAGAIVFKHRNDEKVKCNHSLFGNHYSSVSKDSWINRFLFFIELTFRIIVIWCVVLQLIILYPFCRLHRNVQSIWWKITLKAIEFSGPIFVKFGQWASTRRDIFSTEMCDNLKVLQHQRSPHSWKSTVEILDREFGESWRNIFIHDSPQIPVGSGCAAQVYKMYLRSSDFLVTNCQKRSYDQNDPIPVAVKVLHPNIHRCFYRDTLVITHIATFMQFIFPSLKWISLVECVEEFCQFMLCQMDLEREAFYLEKFSENFSKDNSIQFPQPVYPFVTKHVLVETWEEGDLIGKYLNTQNTSLKKRLSEVLIDCLLKMAFSDNLVHGDLHPGNILVRDNISEEIISTAVLDDIGDVAVLNFTSQAEMKHSLKIILLDCGLSTTLSQKDFENFTSVFRAIVMGQGEEVGRLFLKHCINECRNPESFVKSMAELVAKFRANALSLAVVDVGKLFGSLFDILMKHKVKLESNFSSIMMAILVVEGLGRSLDPHKDLMQDAKNYFLLY